MPTPESPFARALRAEGSVASFGSALSGARQGRRALDLRERALEDQLRKQERQRAMERLQIRARGLFESEEFTDEHIDLALEDPEIKGLLGQVGFSREDFTAILQTGNREFAAQREASRADLAQSEAATLRSTLQSGQLQRTTRQQQEAESLQSATAFVFEEMGVDVTDPEQVRVAQESEPFRAGVEANLVEQGIDPSRANILEAVNARRISELEDQRERDLRAAETEQAQAEGQVAEGVQRRGALAEATDVAQENRLIDQLAGLIRGGQLEAADQLLLDSTDSPAEMTRIVTAAHQRVAEIERGVRGQEAEIARIEADTLARMQRVSDDSAVDFPTGVLEQAAAAPDGVDAEGKPLKSFVQELSHGPVDLFRDEFARLLGIERDSQKRELSPILDITLPTESREFREAASMLTESVKDVTVDDLLNAFDAPAGQFRTQAEGRITTLALQVKNANEGMTIEQAREEVMKVLGVGLTLDAATEQRVGRDDPIAAGVNQSLGRLLTSYQIARGELVQQEVARLEAAATPRRQAPSVGPGINLAPSPVVRESLESLMRRLRERIPNLTDDEASFAQEVFEGFANQQPR